MTRIDPRVEPLRSEREIDWISAANPVAARPKARERLKKPTGCKLDPDQMAATRARITMQAIEVIQVAAILPAITPPAGTGATNCRGRVPCAASRGRSAMLPIASIMREKIAMPGKTKSAIRKGASPSDFFSSFGVVAFSSLIAGGMA